MTETNSRCAMFHSWSVFTLRHVYSLKLIKTPQKKCSPGPICRTLTSLYQNLSSTNPKTPDFPLNLFSTCKSEVIINELQVSPSRTKCRITIPHRTFKNLSKEILACNIERNIKPKFNIFQDLGFSPTGITGIVAADSVDFI
jgi:hypothetical protein